jgi:hypothetical protein
MGGGHARLDGAGCDPERRIEMHPHNGGRNRKDHLVASEWAIPSPGGTLEQEGLRDDHPPKGLPGHLVHGFGRVAEGHPRDADQTPQASQDLPHVQRLPLENDLPNSAWQAARSAPIREQMIGSRCVTT